MGKAVDLRSRVSSYFTTKALGEKTRLLVSNIHKIRITLVESELEALLLEAHLIKKYKPFYNIRLTDGKSYLMVRITIKDIYPRVLIARNASNIDDIYFGPFPNSSFVKLVLKTIRKAFPFQSVANHPKRICLYNHLDLCPCPTMNDSVKLRQMYKKNIKSIIQIFEGKTKKIIRELEKKRDNFSKVEKYEQALIFQKKIEALEYITQPYHTPYEYDVNPNLRLDIRENEIKDLTLILREHGLGIKKLKKIECYDISNTQGTNATGSMVVFMNGDKESSLYRKFKIRRSATPDDFASMKEVLKRRLKHLEWKYPELIIVDGGKGQVSAALETFKEMQVQIPLIGLAKREETIIIPDFQSGKLFFNEVSLPKDVKALHLIQRIRDEAHRFALTYHRKLRSKTLLKV